MHLVIILLAVLGFFLYLTLSVSRNPEKKYYFYLFLLIDLWLSSVFVYLVVTAFLD